MVLSDAMSAHTMGPTTVSVPAAQSYGQNQILAASLPTDTIMTMKWLIE
jgi:hypothetical protein